MSNEETGRAEGMLLTPDFSEARDYTPVPAGFYPALVIDIDPEVWPKGTSREVPTKANGERAYPMVVIHTKIVDMPQYAERYLAPFRAASAGPNAGFLLSAIRAFKPDYKKGDPINLNELIGGRVQAEVTTGMWEGRETNNVRRLYGADASVPTTAVAAVPPDSNEDLKSEELGI